MIFDACNNVFVKVRGFLVEITAVTYVMPHFSGIKTLGQNHINSLVSWTAPRTSRHLR